MNEIVNLLKRDRCFFAIMLLIFGLGIFFGETLPKVDPAQSKTLVELVLKKFMGIAAQIKNQPLWIQVGTIWLNNLMVSLTAAVMSIIPVIPLMLLFGNGLVIGMFQCYTQLHTGMTPWHFYLSLAPHGLFEIPAFVISMGLAFRLGIIPYRLVWHYYLKKEHLPLFREFFRDLRYYAILVVALFTTAAVIEMGISPYIMKMIK